MLLKGQRSRPNPRTVRASKRLGQGLEVLVLVLPGLILLCVFLVWPTIEAIWLSLHQEDLFGRSQIFVGLANFIEMLGQPDFWKSVGASFKFAAIVAPLEIVLGLLAALLVAKNYPGVNFFRTLFFLTTAVPTAVAAVAWGWFLHPIGGWVNQMLEGVGLKAVPWLTDSAFALPTLAVIIAWAGVGFTAILLTAGLQQIPEDLYEAARIDGASEWVQFWRITLPMLSPTLLLVGILIVLRSFTAFGHIHLLTRGGPSDSSTTWIYRVYQDAFFYNRYTYAAAEAVLLFVFLLALALIQFRFFGRKVHYE